MVAGNSVPFTLFTMNLMRYLTANILRNSTASKGIIIFFTLCCVYTLWSRFPEDDTYIEGMAEEALQNVGQDYRYAEIYRKETHLSKDLKYILLWTDPSYAPFYYFGRGQKNLIKNNCSKINCYITADRKFFGGDLSRFDAVLFNGRNLDDIEPPLNLPRQRFPHQKYIYVNTESAANYPVCDGNFDDYFNWTATFRLNSDIILPYMLIKDSEGRLVGPRENMQWDEMDDKIDKEFEISLKNKTKAVAWFVSNCVSKSKREDLVTNLWSDMNELDETLDVYGNCGPLKCPRFKEAECNSMLKNDYFFYLSFENSFDEDYVTEKLLNALNHDVVPVVYGGADYTRFLPPGSYIDARAFTSKQLAKLLHQLKHSPDLYRQFFEWKKHYTYHRSNENFVCFLCEAMNDKTLLETPTIYKEFRKWWNPKKGDHCKPWLETVF